MLKNNMVIMIVGLGSMGRRRIRLLKQYNDNFIIVGVDSNSERLQSVAKEFAITGYVTINEAFHNEKIDVAFVCTSPLSHADIISECLDKDMHIFTELNLVTKQYDDNIKKATEKKRVLFLSSTFLYREEINYIKKKVFSSGKKVNYVYHVGQYLPDWHPWENYKGFFAGKKETNGCREFMAIEFPWIIDTFGEVKSYHVISDKLSSLELNYNDNYMIMFEHKNGNKGLIALDVVSRKASRNLEIFGEDLYITWDGTPNGLKEKNIERNIEKKITLYDQIDKREDYCASIIENAYYSEICSFFATIQGTECAKYSFEKDKDIINLIDKIEKTGGKEHD